MAVRLPGARRVGAFLAGWRGLLVGWSRFLAGWRGLGRFWIAVILLLALGAVVLQTLGPPFGALPGGSLAIVPLGGGEVGPKLPAGPLAVAPGSPEAKGNEAPAPARPPGSHAAGGQPLRPGRGTPGPVADPDPALLVPYAAEPNLGLPRISVDGRAPMAVYASGFDPSSLRPKVGLLIAGIGMSESDSLAAIKELSEGVSLAVSPYATNTGRLLEVARMTGHEYLLSVPMEPQGYPVNDPDDRRALMTSLPPIDNQKRLDWLLARLPGYVGATNAFGQMHGERLSGVPDQLDTVLQDLSRRGLLFVDCRPGQPALPYAWNRSVDLVIDEGPVDAAVLDQRLGRLSQIALDRGSALGLASVPRPVTLARIAAWTTTLTARGLALAPVSALMRPPAKQEPQK